MREYPHLVQRMHDRADWKTWAGAVRQGVDQWFAMEYMGSSEFEAGAQVQCLRDIRSRDLSELVPVEISSRGVSCWFVGHHSLLERATMFFGSELDECRTSRSWTLEPTNVVNVFLRKGSSGSRTVGWWCLDADDGGWAIFTTQEHATNWIAGLRNQKRTS